MSPHRPILRALARCPLWPLALGVVLGVMLGDRGGLDWWWPALAAAALFCLLCRRASCCLFAAGVVLAHGTHGVTVERQAAWLNSLDPEHRVRHAKFAGVVIDTGAQGSGPYLVKVTACDDPANLPAGVRVQLSTPVRKNAYELPAPVLKYGDEVSVEGSLGEVPALRNPHGFDRAAWLHRQGADLTVQPRHRVEATGVSPLRRPVRALNAWRTVLRKRMTLGLDDESQAAQLIRAVVLGERPPRPSAMLQDFRNSGTLHVFAVSGLHVGMVGTIIGLTLWFVRAPRWMLITLTLLGMATYAGITGLRPPSVRAVLMAAVFLSGFLIRRKPTLVNSLAASAVVVLLWDGHQLFTPGFQLSYGVLLALAVLAGFWARLLKPMAEIDPFFPRPLLSRWQETRLNARKWLRNSLSVSLAAWMGSAPLMWVHFGIVTPIAIIAGIPLMLMVFMILALTMFGLAAGALWQPAGNAANQANAWVATATYRSAAYFARLPGSHFFRQPPVSRGSRVIVFDIPYGGGANLLDFGGGVLLDCGRKNHFNRHVLPTLNALRVCPDSLIVSHAESGHSGGMADCLANFRPKQALIPRTDLRSPSYKAFLERAAKDGCKLIVPREGERFPLEPGVHLEILHAPVELEGDGRSDDTGLVIRLHWHGWKILFTGDAGFTTEARMLDSGMDLRADVIVMGRNSDDYSGTEPFIDAVRPRAIVSSGYHYPEEERVPEAWKEAVAKAGVRLFDQEQTGAVTITLAGGNLVLTPMIPAAAPLTLTR